MSQENVEMVRRVYALLDRGDEAVWDLIPGGFVLDFSRRLIDPMVLRGVDQVRAAYLRELPETWSGPPKWEPEELIDAGDKVLAFVRTGARGRSSGVEVEVRVWNLWTFENGKLSKWEYFGDNRPAALEAAGLSEQDARAES
jgi:ketosteroid isomerase-like protein